MAENSNRLCQLCGPPVQRDDPESHMFDPQHSSHVHEKSDVLEQDMKSLHAGDAYGLNV